MKILVDQDEVLAHFVERILTWYNLDHGTKFTVDDITEFHMGMNLGPDSEIYIRNYMRYPNFFRELEPVPGAVEGMRELIGQGHEVYVVTTVPKSAGLGYEGKKEWLREHMPFFDLEHFITTHRKAMVRGDVLIDDGPHNLVPFAEAGGVSVAFDRPWNRDLKTLRAQTWDDVLEIVRTLSNPMF